MPKELLENRMKIGIVIPAHNEADFIQQTLDSLVNQTHLPDVLCVVDDHSTDATPNLIAYYSEKYDWIHGITIDSSDQHQPGAKVVRAWKQGLNFVADCDVVCKFDADLIFPQNYVEQVVKQFSNHPNLGIFGGMLQVANRSGQWVDERISNADHIRGPIKAYRKNCLEQMGGLKEALGWDTLDVLMAQYHGWETATTPNLKVKHLRPTGSAYAMPKHVETFYTMRYGYIISMLAVFKQQGFAFAVWHQAHKAYLKAKSDQLPFLINKAQGVFVRRMRWRGIWKKLLKRS